MNDSNNEMHHGIEVKSSKRKKVIIIFIVLSFILIAVGYTVLTPFIRYREASSFLQNGEYEKAIDAFIELEDYKNSSEMVSKSRYKYAKHLMDQKDYANAVLIFTELAAYEDSQKL